MKDNSKSLLEKVWMIVKKNILVSATLIFVVVLVVVSLGIVGISRIRENRAKQRAYDALSDEDKALLAQDFTLVKDGYDFVNNKMTDYLNALSNNDQNFIKQNLFEVSSNELDNIEVKSKYTEYYDNIVCYTQNGYAPESYYVYVTADLHIVGIDTPAPSIMGLYYAKDSTGSYRIYKRDDMDVDVLENFYIAYMKQPVQDIYNQISLSYSEALDSDEKLKDFMIGYDELIKNDLVAVYAERERIAQEEAAANQVEQNTNVEENVKATTSVNVRSSDSETAERLGTVSEGTVLKRVEAKLNGWSKVIYEGKEAYIKSEYLNVVDSDGNVVEDTNTNNNIQTANNDTNTNNTTTTGNTTNTDNGETKYVTAIDNVNIRAEADIDSERVGFAYNGDKLELVEKLTNGWTKVKYNGKICYVKTDYVQ